VTRGWTYGVELEWPDVDVRTPLPDGWTWSRTDYTVVNSDGVANDPKHEIVLRGGELNSPPFISPDAMGAAVYELAELLRPGHNYRSNTHIHIRVDDLEDDLPRLKMIADRLHEYLPGYVDVFDPLDALLTGQDTEDELRGARERRRHSKRSRHYFTSETRHKMRLEAGNLEEFLACEVPRARNGRPCWALAPREAVNLRSIRKHGTIEFRCFAGSRSGEEVATATTLAGELLGEAYTGGQSYGDIIRMYLTDLPFQVPYNHQLELGWQRTNLQHNDRETVRLRLREMGIAE
jgi:hypothetical protein